LGKTSNFVCVGCRGHGSSIWNTCAALGVTVVLIELDPKYVDIAVIRWQVGKENNLISSGDSSQRSSRSTE
jgi:hypothetical protein